MNKVYIISDLTDILEVWEAPEEALKRFVYFEANFGEDEHKITTMYINEINY